MSQFHTTFWNVILKPTQMFSLWGNKRRIKCCLLHITGLCPRNVHVGFVLLKLIVVNILGLRNKSNTEDEELDKLIKHENTVNCIKVQTLSWFGHIQRMSEAHATKKTFKCNPLTTRPRGRPKYRWEDNIIQGLGQMKIKKLVNL